MNGLHFSMGILQLAVVSDSSACSEKPLAANLSLSMCGAWGLGERKLYKGSGKLLGLEAAYIFR